ncbi:hypothetical protein [Burkholderia sp. IMCC1007]|uniref:hypothetical protein n=1 Tax=Burkholderia sp. IMCC1007 TaxID=3004104 RepID=UPI0022B367F5|nr:hypothetical protein [Burkholderia sp. IMCC1007]
MSFLSRKMKTFSVTPAWLAVGLPVRVKPRNGGLTLFPPNPAQLLELIEIIAERRRK